MKKLKQKLYKLAQDNHGNISLCPTVKTLDESFSTAKIRNKQTKELENHLVFWLNVGKDTLAVSEAIWAY